MTRPLLGSWRRARTLDERRRASEDPGGGEPESEARDRARRRLDRWRAQRPFEDPAWWRRRLALDRLDEPTFLRLLADPGRADEPAPEWVRRLSALYHQPSVAEAIEAGGFPVWVEPLLVDARLRLRRRLAPSDDFERDALRWLARRLRRRVLRTALVEMHIAGLEGELPGETPEERFAAFAHASREPGVALEQFDRYPVLARHLVGEVDRWWRAIEDLVTHAAADRSTLASHFAKGADPGEIAGFDEVGGDPHRDGRVVLQVRFRSGLRLAYKPRSLAPEEAFRTLLHSLEKELGDRAPRMPRGLDLGDHGWVEWLEPRPCESPAALERFYGRQGALLALLHLFGATDLHHENSIAVGEQPMIVDLETLAHPVLVRERSLLDDGLAESVLRVGLLPHRLSIGGDALDPSGLGAEAGQAVSGGWRLEDIGTDRMRIVPGAASLGATPGRPVLDGEPGRLSDHADAVLAGFRAARRAARERRGEWRAAGGVLESLRRASTRIVLRPTRVYALLLRESFHPHLLRDAVDRDRHFDRLWLGVRHQPLLEGVVSSERRDLERGDIPLFTAPVDSRHVYDAAGEDLGELLPESGFDGILRRLEALDAREDARQEHWVRATFELRAAEEKRRPRPRSIVIPAAVVPASTDGAERPASPERRLDWAKRAGDRLAELAFRGESGARWLVPRRLAADRWTLVEAGPDLYFGLAGIALFLAWLAEIGGEDRHATLAEETLATLRRQLALDPEIQAELGLASPGAFEGLGGVIYALVELAALRGDRGLLELAESRLDALAEAIERDDRFDVSAGIAGALLALRRLGEARPSTRATTLAERCAERLATEALRVGPGLGWPPPEGAAGPLAGMAHGVAGIAWSLAESGHCNAEYDAEHDAALDYEDTLFVEAEGNWRDLRARPRGEAERFLAAWCHGAPGIGLARLASVEARPDRDEAFRARVARDLDRAVAATWEGGFGLGHSLCHGDLGNLDFLLEASRYLERSDLQNRVERSTGSLVASLDAQGFLFGTPGGTEPPGLMVGLAGIGYGLLRTTVPERVPSVLRLGSSKFRV